MAADDVAVAVEDRADRVHDREDRDPRLSDLPERGALAAGSPSRVVENLPDGGRAAGAVRSEREDALARRTQGRSPELLVRIDRVVARPPVEDDRAGDDRDVHPAGVVLAPREQLGGNAGGRLQSVQRPARQADRRHQLVARAADPWRAAADVDRSCRALRKVEDGTAGRALVVLGDADLETGEIELENRPVQLGSRSELGRVVG